MAVTATPVFPQTPFDGPVSFSGVCTDFTGATTGSLTTVVTAGANGAQVKGILFNAVGTVAAPTQILIFHDDGGTRRLYGTVLVAPPGGSQAPTNDVPPYSVYWANPNPILSLNNGDKFDCAQYSGTTVWHAVIIGGHL